jgi:hypothetical protein
MNDIFRTVRELIENRDCVLMGNAVNTEGKLYDDSVENLTAILAMQDSYGEMLAAMQRIVECAGEGDLQRHALTAAWLGGNALDKAKGTDQ